MPAACAKPTGDVTVDGAFERLSGIIAEMRDAITRTRMQRIENLFVGLPRMVRDLSAELGKQVMVDIDGGDVELDREMIEMIRDPLTHIIRNAVDHGIELPAERLKAGKREIGLLSISARQSGNQILIDIADDGRGIDGKRLVEKAIAAGLIDKAEAAALGPREQLALIFEAGLSTAQEVTSISGRGVGMDVVRSNVERIGGVVEVDSTPGAGHPHDPARAADADDHSRADRQHRQPAFRHSPLGDRGDRPRQRRIGRPVAGRRGRGRDHPRPPRSGSRARRHSWASKRCEGRRTAPWSCFGPPGGDVYALAVDKIHDHEELVVKPAAPAVMATGLYAGTTLADDGSPILLFDPAGLAEVGGVHLEAQERAARVVEDSSLQQPPARSRCCCSAVSTARAAQCAWRSSTGSRKSMPRAIKPGAGQLRVQLGESILPLAGVPERDHIAKARSACSASTMASARSATPSAK